MRKVKIVCTLGPACGDIGKLRAIAAAGMNVARFNFSHGDYEGHGRMLELTRQVERETGTPIASILDTKGPEIRTGLLAGHKDARLAAGSVFRLVTNECEGDAERVSISYAGLPKEVAAGQNLYIDDGEIHLEVTGTEPGCVVCRVMVGGDLGEHKGVNVPGADLSVPTLTEKDAADIEWGIDHDMDYIAVSFVRRREDITQVRRVIERRGGRAKSVNVMAKIETVQSVQNIEDIIQVVDAVMIARGDLGVEMPAEMVPMVQKRIIEMCRALGKPVVVATQMLDSMMRNPRPTRAEAADVANAVLDGADAVMLSGETAGGRYPVESAEMMAKIIETTEREGTKRFTMPGEDARAKNAADSVSHSAMMVASELGAAAVLSLTRSGSTAAMVSKYRPSAPILASTPLVSTWRALSLMWGVRPFLAEERSSSEDAVDTAMDSILERGYVREGDAVVITTGFPVSVPGTTNMLLVRTVGKILFRAPSLIKTEASGIARKAESASDADARVAPGNVLVVRKADAGYARAMKKAAAIITEEHGVTNFTSLTALQLGIPCVSYEGAFDLLRDGALVTVDGARGVVYEGRVKTK
ncbi:MAG: pyruvate kinase [Synergistaceae bacterium]|jgi:pyruvate kinase|nr:pyruvate kinase [Synergistaceae bacterium]